LCWNCGHHFLPKTIVGWDQRKRLVGAFALVFFRIICGSAVNRRDLQPHMHRICMRLWEAPCSSSQSGASDWCSALSGHSDTCVLFDDQNQHSGNLSILFDRMGEKKIGTETRPAVSQWRTSRLPGQYLQHRRSFDVLVPFERPARIFSRYLNQRVYDQGAASPLLCVVNSWMSRGTFPELTFLVQRALHPLTWQLHRGSRDVKPCRDRKIQPKYLSCTESCR